MKRQFFQYIKDQVLVTETDTIVVGCSGGPDSMALLALLYSLQDEIPFKLLVAHLDHSIRTESSKDSLFVEVWCRKHHLEYISTRIDIPSIAKERKISIELAARIERHMFLQCVAERYSCSLIALGHHKNDQSETILHRIVRGTGISGLCGMKVRDGVLFRPLLGFTRAEIVDWLGRESISYLIDPSNSDVKFTRNRFRHEILPELAKVNPKVDEALVRLGDISAREEGYWQQEVQSHWHALSECQKGEYFICRESLAVLHPAVQYRLIRYALQKVRGDLSSITEVHLDSIVSLITSSKPQSEWQGPEVWVATRYDKVWFRSQAPPLAEQYCLDLSRFESLPLPSGGLITVSDRYDHGEQEDKSGCFRTVFPKAFLTLDLQFRPFLPGDRMAMAAGGRKKVKEIFAEHKIWYERRARIPLLVANGMVIWIPGVRGVDCLGENRSRSEGAFFCVKSGDFRSFLL